MSATTHRAYSQASVSVLSTEFNSLATATATAAGSAFDNSALRDLFGDFELVLAAQGTNRAAGARIELYCLPAVDGTNYEDFVDGLNVPIVTFNLDSGALAARRQSPEHAHGIPLLPCSMKFLAKNVTGQTLAASGTSIKLRTRSVQSA